MPVQMMADKVSFASCLGYPMARNLRANMPKEDVLMVHDIDQGAVERFMDESGRDIVGGEKGGDESAGLGGAVEIGRSVREVAERCVSPQLEPYRFWPNGVIGKSLLMFGH